VVVTGGRGDTDAKGGIAISFAWRMLIMEKICDEFVCGLGGLHLLT
jgi:hypothetical protein